MMHSMTGYANAGGAYGGRQISVELRAVNHRYLDIQFKMPDDLRHLEGRMREIIDAKVHRGKLECRVQWQTTGTAATEGLQVNRALVAQLAQLNSDLRKQHKDLAKLGVADLLRFPGVLVAEPEDEDALAEGVLALLHRAMADFNQSRAREGEKLQQHLLARLDDINDIVHALMQLFPHLLQQHVDKAEQRLRDAMAHIDDDRIKQEFVIFMQKADVDEELSRLQTHIAEVRRLVSEHKGSVGKRLDFLMQELNREANTLGSKAIAAESTQASVGLKVLIEQMREQVQNVE